MAKEQVAHVEVASSVDDSTAVKELGDEDSQVGFSKPETSRLLRKLDRTLLPFLSFLYLLSFLDRANIGNAKLAGLERDLNMTGYDYSIAVAIFFPFYVIAEVPSNMAMKRFRPSIWIPSIMVVWGFMTIMLGVVQSFGGLLAVRSLLGLAEGGLFPGITYYITMWYRRHECGLRMAIFFSAATAAGAFGGLLARGIMEMQGVGGLSGWNWIFILEGLATFVVALIAYRVMHDYPESVKFLTSEQKKEVVRRLKQDRSALSNEFKLSFAKDALKDWRIWVHMFITIGIYIPLYSISVFLPTIVKGLGYTNEVAQLMSVPPYAVACLFTVGGGFNIVAILGFALLAGVEHNGVKYLACFLVTVGVYPNVPQGVAWNGNNIGGSLKRAVGIAMHVGFGNLGGAVSGFVFRQADAPRYLSGHLALVGTLSMSLVLSVFMTIHLRRENARRDAQHKPLAEYTNEEKLRESEMGDNATFFRYTV
ncbi:hypothetical protein BB8028_0003g08200 [Beauveria bassiana]|uniref:Major facilitator superfamily (MFS) profile domain-containing protein n=1 Tax=Beauveria bassiana TaxID=176275 RepID=A0A2S7Y8C5_BEABA|nr:hypothetical protein BB8028_0003g08200 [Beauveria bassiana]